MTAPRDDTPSVDPQSDAADMTPQQRLVEVAAILAAGVLRLWRRGRTQENPKFCPAPLDVPPDSRLTVPRG
jgi:hypothetical protein